MLTHAAGRAWTAVLEHTLVRDAVTALDSRQLRRIELAKQAKVVGDDPDGRDKTLRDNENVDRAYLDVALRRRHGAQWRRERADVASAHEECDDDPVGCLDGVQDVHAEPVKGLLQRPRLISSLPEPKAVLYELVAVEPPELMASSAMRWENEFSLAGILVKID